VSLDECFRTFAVYVNGMSPTVKLLKIKPGSSGQFFSFSGIDVTLYILRIIWPETSEPG
jgi:hypothetical protein